MTWLLAHGELVWWTALALSVVAGAPAVWRLTRRRARRLAAEVRDGLGTAETRVEGLDDGAVTLHGILEAGDAGEDAAGGGVVAGTKAEPAEGLRLRLEDAEVELVAPPFVRVGSRERWPGWRAAPWDVIRSLRAGDRVVARGTLTARVEADAYRGQRRRWLLDLAEEEGGVVLAYTGHPRVKGPRPKSFAFGVVGGAVLFVALTYLVGALSLGIAERLHEGDPDDPARVLPAAAVAATSYFHRDRALDLAARSLYPDAPGRAERVATAADLEHAMTGQCTGLLAALWRDGGVHRMADVAERCGDPASLRLGARGALVDGQLERAAELARRAPAADATEPDPDARWTEVLAYLLAGEHANSAASLRAIAGGVDDAERRASYTCIADSLDIHASGEEDPDLENLEDGSEGPGVGACWVLLLDHFDPELRQVMLAIDETDLDFRFGPLRDALGMESVTDITLPLAAPFDHPVDLATGRLLRDRSPLGLDAAAIGALEGEEMGPGLRASLAAARSRLAGFLAATGDTDGALALLGDAERDLVTVRDARGEDFAWSRVLAWLPLRRAAVQVRAGDLEAAQRELESADPSIADTEPAEELDAVLRYLADGDASGLSDDWEAQLGVSGLRLALETGDGAALERWLRHHPPHVTTLVAQLAARHVDRNHEALIAWLERDQMPARCPTMEGCRLDLVAADAFSRAIAARALGDDELATRLERRARFLREALSRRDVALTWALLGRLRADDEDGYSVTP